MHRRRCSPSGQSVLLVAAHQCNWEWMLLALSLELGYPLDAAYKPLVNAWAEREMKKLRTRFGSRLVPAQDLLPDILKRHGVVRASPWSPTRSRPGASASTGRASSTATRRSTWVPRRSHG